MYKQKPRCGNNIICINKLRNERVWGPLAKLKKTYQRKNKRGAFARQRFLGTRYAYSWCTFLKY